MERLGKIKWIRFENQFPKTKPQAFVCDKDSNTFMKTMCQRHKLQLCQMQHETVKEFRASPKIGRDGTSLLILSYKLSNRRKRNKKS